MDYRKDWNYHVSIFNIRPNELLWDSNLSKYFFSSGVLVAHLALSRNPSLSSVSRSRIQPSRSENVITHPDKVTTTSSTIIRELPAADMTEGLHKSNCKCKRTERRIWTVINISLISCIPVFRLDAIRRMMDDTSLAAERRPAIEAATESGSMNGRIC